MRTGDGARLDRPLRLMLLLGTRPEAVKLAPIALSALAFSVFIVYLLEIVKLANPRIRRRERGKERTRDRMSA